VPLAPFQRLHADPAAAALEAAGGTIELGIEVGDVRGLLGECDAVVLAVPHGAAAELVPGGEEWLGLGESPIVNVHVHYDRTVLLEPPATPPRPPGPFGFYPPPAAGGPRGPPFPGRPSPPGPPARPAAPAIR